MKKWEKNHLEKKVQNNNTDENIASHCTQITYLLNFIQSQNKVHFASKNKIELENFQVNIYIYIREPFIFTIILKKHFTIYLHVQDLKFKFI